MRGRTSGLTVIELMVALAVAGIAFAALAFSQVTGFRVTRSSQGAAIAKDVGMKQLEIIRGFGYGYYRDCPTSPAGEGGVPGCSGDEIPQEHPGFTVNWRITDAPAGIDNPAAPEPPALLGVEIWVTWEDTRYDLVGYLSCGDPGESATTEVPCPRTSLLAGGS